MQWRYSMIQNIAMFTSVLPVLVAWMFVDTLDWYPYFLSAAGGVLLAVALSGAVSKLRGRLLRGSAAFTAGEVAAEHAPGGFVLWLAPPMWGIAAGLFVNAYLDPSPPREYPSEVLRRTSPSKGPGHVILRGYRPGEKELSIHADSRLILVMQLSGGAEITIIAREGLFGWDRIEAIVGRR